MNIILNFLIEEFQSSMLCVPSFEGVCEAGQLMEGKLTNKSIDHLESLVTNFVFSYGIIHKYITPCY